MFERFHSGTNSGFSLSLSDAVESKKGRGSCSRNWAAWRPKPRTKTLKGTHAELVSYCSRISARGKGQVNHANQIL